MCVGRVVEMRARFEPENARCGRRRNAAQKAVFLSMKIVAMPDVELTVTHL